MKLIDERTEELLKEMEQTEYTDLKDYMKSDSCSIGALKTAQQFIDMMFKDGSKFYKQEDNIYLRYLNGKSPTHKINVADETITYTSASSQKITEVTGTSGDYILIKLLINHRIITEKP